MVSQITSGLGGTAPLPTIDQSAVVAPSTPTTQLAPQYQLNFVGLTRSSALGLSAPTSSGDLEILFAQIANALKESLGALDDANAVSRSETRRGQLGNVLAAAQFMLGAGNEVDANRDNITKQQGVIDAQTVIKTTAETEKRTLESSKSTKEGTIRSNNQTIGTYNQRITDLGTEQTNLSNELGKLKLPGDAARISAIYTRMNAIPGEIQGLSGQIETLQSNNRTLQGEIDALVPRIAAQQSIIDEATRKIDAATQSRDSSKKRIDTLKDAMNDFVSGTLPMLILLLGKTKSDMAGDAGEVDVTGDSFETILANAAQALVKLGEALAESRAGSDIVMNTEGAGLNLDQSTPERFGQPSAPVARAMVFAGLVASTLGAVADVLRSLTAGLGMQTAESFAVAGEPRMRVPL